MIGGYKSGVPDPMLSILVTHCHELIAMKQIDGSFQQQPYQNDFFSRGLYLTTLIDVCFQCNVVRCQQMFERVCYFLVPAVLPKVVREDRCQSVCSNHHVLVNVRC